MRPVVRAGRDRLADLGDLAASPTSARRRARRGARRRPSRSGRGRARTCVGSANGPSVTDTLRSTLVLNAGGSLEPRATTWRRPRTVDRGVPAQRAHHRAARRGAAAGMPRPGGRIIADLVPGLRAGRSAQPRRRHSWVTGTARGAADGIAVNVVAPGSCQTGFWSPYSAAMYPRLAAPWSSGLVVGSRRRSPTWRRRRRVAIDRSSRCTAGGARAALSDVSLGVVKDLSTIYL